MMRRRTNLAGLVLLGGAMLAGPAPAQDGDSARMAAMQACGSIAKKSARLACYDAQMQGGAAPTTPAPVYPVLPAATAAPAGAAATPMPTSSAIAPVPARLSVAARSAAAPAVGPQPSFGERAQPQKQAEAKEVRLRAVSARDNGLGQYLITLEDGARWRMTETVSNFEPPHEGDMVRIRKAAMGSYLMDFGHQAAVRVSRVQ